MQTMAVKFRERSPWRYEVLFNGRWRAVRNGRVRVGDPKELGKFAYAKFQLVDDRDRLPSAHEQTVYGMWVFRAMHHGAPSPFPSRVVREPTQAMNDMHDKFIRMGWPILLSDRILPVAHRTYIFACKLHKIDGARNLSLST